MPSISNLKLYLFIFISFLEEIQVSKQCRKIKLLFWILIFLSTLHIFGVKYINFTCIFGEKLLFYLTDLSFFIFLFHSPPPPPPPRLIKFQNSPVNQLITRCWPGPLPLLNAQAACIIKGQKQYTKTDCFTFVSSSSHTLNLYFNNNNYNYNSGFSNRNNNRRIQNKWTKKNIPTSETR